MKMHGSLDRPRQACLHAQMDRRGQQKRRDKKRETRRGVLQKRGTGLGYVKG